MESYKHWEKDWRELWNHKMITFFYTIEMYIRFKHSFKYRYNEQYEFMGRTDTSTSAVQAKRKPFGHFSLVLVVRETTWC